MNKILFAPKIKHQHLFKHATKSHVLLKFFLVLFVFLAYFLFIAKKYGLQQGFLVAVLSWSFFVLCTPVADAGFLIDFPLRLITKLRMFVTEIFVWIAAIFINLYALTVHPEIYARTNLLIIFKNILTQPIPFWIIIFLSLIGTFASIKFGDELLDKVNHHERTLYKKHKSKYQLLLWIFLFSVTLAFYNLLLKKLNLHL